MDCNRAFQLVKCVTLILFEQEQNDNVRVNG